MNRKAGWALGHSSKCLLNSCIEFNNALFHIFSGPLFANVEGYAYLDLIIWGLSPLIFLLIRPKLLLFIDSNKALSKSTHLRLMIFLCALAVLSYLSMNYSDSLAWNMFSKSFNVDFGYFLFDFLMRMFSLLVEVEEDEEGETECEGYCELKHSSTTLVYLVVFYFSSTYDVNQPDSGTKVFSVACCFSFFFTCLIPLLYYFKNQERIAAYSPLGEREQVELSGIEFEEVEVSTQWDRSILAYLLINSSLLININYFSLWMMEPLGQSAESSSQQYNITIEMVSGFFMLSSFSYFIAFRLYNHDYGSARRMSKVILFMYGMALAYIYWVYEVNYICIVLLGFGFQRIAALYLGTKLQNQKQIDHRFQLYNEVLVYFVLPLLYNPLKIGTTSLNAYALTSGLLLVLGSVLM